MKRVIILHVILFSFKLTHSQNFNTGLNVSDSIVQIQSEVCRYYVNSNFYKSTVYPNVQLQERLNGDNPCSTFLVNYNGFTQEAQSAFEYALSIWENSLDSPVPIRIVANFASLQNNQVGFASPSGFILITGPEIPANTIFPLALAERILGYEITQNGQPTTDINVQINSSANFYYGTDGNPGADQIDFVTVVLHELAHGLGFAGLANVINNGTEGALRNSGLYTTMYDSFIENGLNISILSFPDPSSELLLEFTGDNLFCNGDEAINQNNGLEPKIFAPNIFAAASSYVHWDETTYPPGSQNSLMTPGISPGEAIHNPGSTTLGIMYDIGWEICGSLLGIDDFVNNDLSVYPNPFKEDINVKISESKRDNYHVEIFNLSGKKLFKKQYNNTNFIQLRALDRLDKGLYIMKIKSEASKMSLIKKIIKY